MQGYPESDFTRVLYPAELIKVRVKELAGEIKSHYANISSPDSLVIICVMNGAMTFMADLGRLINLDSEYGFMQVASYGADTIAGELALTQDMDINVANRHVLIVEDIVDTGHTLHFIRDLLKRRNPASLRTCCLLDKELRREIEAPVEYVGFTMERDEFVVGYGLDYAGRYRNLPHVAVLNPDVYSLKKEG